MSTHAFIRGLLIAGVTALAATTAAAEVVVIGHVGAPALTRGQVADVFTGKNQSLVPVDQAESAPIRAEFYSKVTGKDPSQVKALWSRLIFTGKGTPPRELPDAAAVKKAVAADPLAIGYIDKSEVDGSVKVLVGID